MSGYNTMNYKEQGGDLTHIGGVLEFGDEARIVGFPGAENQASSDAGNIVGLKSDFNALLVKLKNAGIMAADEWNVSVLKCPNTSTMKTAETIANSGHVSDVAADGNHITITLDCKVSELADADHGEEWGIHKWLGFGVRTGLGSIEGIAFTNDDGTDTVLTADDVAEASALELSQGDFVLFVRAEDTAFLSGGKHFTLDADGYAKTVFSMQIVELEK